jgi:hypothetical protein
LEILLTGFRRTAAFLFAVAAGSTAAWAQTDYRNLDGERPTFIADAYPIERWAFELAMPWRFERAASGGSAHIFGTELSYGMFRNAQVGIELPIAAVDQGPETTWGLAGLRAFGLYNLTTESGTWPAISLRADLALPVGANGGDATRAGAQLLATRSFGAQRVHVNVSAAAGSDGGPRVESLPRWSAGAALDRTFIRESLLLIGEVYALRHGSGEPTEAVASLGARWQLSPTLVVDGGVGRRLTNTGPDVTVTLGLSHAFALAGLLPSVHGAPRPGRPR